MGDSPAMSAPHAVQRTGFDFRCRRRSSGGCGGIKARGLDSGRTGAGCRSDHDLSRGLGHVAAETSPGARLSRSTGRSRSIAATTTLAPSTTGALTEATPGSRSSTLSTQPPGVTPRSTRPAEPTSSGSSAPSGTIQRSPCGDCSDTTQRRASPSRTNSCTLSPVASRSALSTGRGGVGERERVGRRPPEARSSSKPEAEPPDRRRAAARPCASSATARRCAVARGSPVALCSSAEVERARVRAAPRTSTALSSTPTPRYAVHDARTLSQ